MGSELKPFQVEKPWGNFRQFTRNMPSTVKILSFKAGEGTSLQSHKGRWEFWHVISGDGMMEIGGLKYEVKEGDENTVIAEVKHRITAGKDGMKVLEISTGNFDEEDIVRYEDIYGRV